MNPDDFRALGELIWFSFLGLSVFGVVMGFTVRAFIAPLVREAMDRLGEARSQEHVRSIARLETVEARLSDLETEVHRLGAAEEFHRRLQSGRPAEEQGDDPASAPRAGSGEGG